MKTMTRLTAAGAFLFFGTGAAAQTWNIPGGIPIHTNVSGAQEHTVLCVTAVRDGIIYAWRDTRTGTVSQDIYAQKLDPCGNVAPGWPAGGLIVCNATANQQFPQIVADASGGAIITWQDTRAADWDIYAQHVLSTGVVDPAWPANGQAICTQAGNQQNPHLCTDGAGGAVIVWDDNRSGNWDIWAQKISQAGVVQWAAGGVPVCVQTNTQDLNAIATDSAGGAFIAWEDNRPVAAGIDVYAMRINSNGNQLWTTNGIILSNLPSGQKEPCIANTGGQTAMFAWADDNGTGQSIQASRLDGAGALMPGWVTNGNFVSFAITSSGNPGTASSPRIAADCGGGAIISFRSPYGGGDNDVLTKQMSATGVGGPLQYTAFGVSWEGNHEIARDGKGNAFVVFEDRLSPTQVHYVTEITGASGTVSAGTGTRNIPNVTAMQGVAYFVWEDSRPGTLGAHDLYGASTSALAPPPILNSNLTQTYNANSCNIATQNVTACAGVSITFTVPLPAGLFTTYTFYDGATALQSGASNTFTTSALAAGTHTITATSSTAGGCVTAASNQIIVTVSAGPTVSPFSQVDVACNGGSTGSASVTASGGNPAYTYNWTPSGGTGASASSLAAGTYTCTVTDAIGCAGTQTFNITQPAVISSTVTTTAAACAGNNGTASVNVSGGTPGYTYLWAPSGGTGSTASSLAAGTYTCTITDNNGCTHQAIATVNSASGPAVSLSAQGDVSCNGGANGSATIAASGGTAPYTYSWSPSGGTGATATGLAAGTYTCTVTDAAGCVQAQTVTITQPAALTASVTSTGVSCNTGNNGSATVTVSGGTPGYTYSWSPSGGTGATATGLPAGTYTCAITDANSCPQSVTVTINAPAAISVTPSQFNVSCNGGNTGSASVSVSGGTPGYTYSWSPSGGTAATETNLTAGTYTCTITDANSCTQTQTFSITEPAAVTAAISATNELCGNANGSATVVASGGIPGYTYSWSPSGGTAATETNLAAGTYSCLVTDAGGCPYTATVTVGFTAGPAVSLASSSPALCNGGSTGSATVSASGGTPSYSYAWTPSGGTGATGLNLSAGNYTCTVTDANGCIQTQAVTITEPSAVSASYTSVDATCNNNNGSATVSPSGGTPGYTFSWSSGGTAATESNLAAGVYSCVITDANGCTDTISAGINNTGAPVVTVAGQADVTCNGGSNGSATVSASGGTPGYTYAWTPSGGTAATASGLGAGGYICTVTDAAGCVQTQTVTITEPSALAPALTSVDETCGSGNGSATVSVSGGTGPYTYSWSSGGTAATESGLAAGSYTCLITDASGCTATDSVTIINTGNPSVSIFAQTDVSCSGGSNGSVAVNVIGGTGPYTYAWTSGGTSLTESNLSAGSYTCTVTDANGCTQTQVVAITEPAALSSSVIPVDATCGNSNGSATINVTGGTGPYTYNWSPSSQTTATASNLAGGTYTCVCVDANGCNVTDSATISSTPAPVLSGFSQQDLLCNNDASGSATVNVTGGSPGYTYSWSPSGGNGATATGLFAGLYTCTITDSANCTLTQTFAITEPAAITAPVTTTSIACSGGSGTATVTPAGGTPGYTYSWSPAGGTGATATGLAANTYTCMITDANGCTFQQTVTLTEPTAITAAASSTPACGPGNGSAAISAGGGTPGYTYSWSPAGGTGATATGLSSGSYTCTVTDANGCVLSATVNVTANPLPVVAVTPPVTIITGTGTTLTASGAATYVWTPSTGLDNPNSQAPVASPQQTTVYCVTGTDAAGCSDTACTIVTVNTECGELFVPTAFSPNSDGENDVLCIYGNQCITELEFSIYDRWGEKVYETTDKDDCWDGMYKGQAMNSGVFVYQLSATLVNGQQVTLKGNITLVR